jgi:DNA-binding NarL/FixJ family response regulator
MQSRSRGAASARRVMVVARHALILNGLSALVSRDARFAVVAEVQVADEAIEAARRLSPDACVVELCMATGLSHELVAQLRKVRPRMGIIAIGPDGRRERIAAVAKAGASGYVRHGARLERLIDCLSISTNGGFCVDEESLLAILDDGTHAPPSTSADALTSRQRDVLVGTANGKHPKEIAAELKVSRKTVENLRSQLMAKLGLSSIIDLARYAVRAGYVDIEEWQHRG